MLTEQPRVQWAPGVLRIVMLVASGLIDWGVNPCSISGARSLQSVWPFHPLPALRPSANRQPSTGNSRRRLVPSGGRIGSGGALPSPWRFQGLFHASLAIRLSLRTALPASDLPVLSFHPFRLCSQDRAFPSHLPARLEPADDGAPLAASAVRGADSEGLTTRVFRRYCGHRCHPDQVELSCYLSGR